MKISDLILGADGKIVQTKLAGATFHLLIAVAVAWVTWLKRDFIVEMWSMYAVAALGHSIYDKTSAQVSAFKNRQLDASAAAPDPTAPSQPVAAS